MERARVNRPRRPMAVKSTGRPPRGPDKSRFKRIHKCQPDTDQEVAEGKYKMKRLWFGYFNTADIRIQNIPALYQTKYKFFWKFNMERIGALSDEWVYPSPIYYSHETNHPLRYISWQMYLDKSSPRGTLSIKLENYRYKLPEGFKFEADLIVEGINTRGQGVELAHKKKDMVGERTDWFNILQISPLEGFAGLGFNFEVTCTEEDEEEDEETTESEEEEE